MSKIKHGLGRGLDALLSGNNPAEAKLSPELTVRDKGSSQTGSSSAPVPGQTIPVELIEPNPFQPRTNFDPAALEELKNSIIANGLIQPVTVRKNGTGYQLISGERRLRAFREIGYEEIPAYVIEVASDELMLAMALIENIQRERLNPIEESLAYKRLMDECSLTQEEIAMRVGKNRTTIANSVRLLKLPPEIQDKLITEEISIGHARALINLPTVKEQIRILDAILTDNLSVRQVENLVKQAGDIVRKKSKTPTHASKIHEKDVSLNSIEDVLRKTLGTKVIVSQKANGSGDIYIEFYSHDELDRLLDLFSLIEKNNS